MSRVIYLVIVSFLMSGCGEMSGIRGKGEKIREDLDLKTFDKIELDIMADIFLTHGEDQSVSVEAQENILKNLKTKVSDKKLVISEKSGVRFSKRVTFHITSPEIKEIIYKGSGNIRTTNPFIGQDEIILETENQGDFDLHLEARSIKIGIEGSGDVELMGKTDELKVKASGSGSLDAYDLVANRCEVEIEGSGNVKVDVRDRLEATVKDRGSVFYKGNPEVITETTGSGKIRAIR